MISAINIKGLERKIPPVLSAEWDGKPVAIRLDSSAILKLEGNAGFDDLEKLLTEKVERVSLAAQRVLEMRQTEIREGRLEVVLSALDLD